MADKIQDTHILKKTSLEYIAVWVFEFWTVYYTFGSINAVGNRHQAQLSHHYEPSWGFLSQWSHGIDMADTQWRDFVRNLPLLGSAMVGFALTARTIRGVAPSALVPFYLVAGFGMVAYLHGIAVVFMLGLVLINFGIAQLHSVLPYPVYMLLVWVTQVGILFVNDHFHGYSLGMLHPSLEHLHDQFPGVLRWHVIFNMSTLRMIAFNYDIWEARFLGAETRERVEKKHRTTCVDCAVQNGPCYKLRTDSPRHMADYNLVNYLAYLLYVPLYIAGPMSSFNAFVNHLRTPQRHFDVPKLFKYARRVVSTMLVLMVYLHFVPLNAIRFTPSVLDALTIHEKVSFGFCALAFLWLKFDSLWKFFRLLALIDGVEAPEDMNRCFCNTVTVQSFWRDWHSSFNIWIVRYMYIPLGGSKNKFLVIFPIFGFIALWHDIQLHMFWWALVMCVSFVPEIAVSAYFYSNKMRWLRQKPYWRYLRQFGAVCSITGLVGANMVGFGGGTKTTGDTAANVIGKDHLSLVFSCLLMWWCSSTIGIVDRDTERERHQKLKVQLGLAGDPREE